MKMQQRCGGIALAGMFLFGIALGQPAVAQSYPSRPINFVVPAAAGGPTDAVTRLIADQMSKSMGVPVIVEPKPGGGGNIGANYVAKSAPDGYTLLMATLGTHAVNETLYSKLQFDPQKDFEAVTQVVSYPLVIAVRPDLGVNTVGELVKLAKTRQLNRGSGGSGTSMHLSGEYFNSMARVQMTHVPYKGSAPAVTDLLGGQIDLIFDTILTVLPHVKQGKLKVIGVTTDSRSPVLPDVPAISETVSGYSMSSWIGVVVAKGTPKPIVDKLQAEIVKALNVPEVREKLLSQAAQPVGSTPEQFREFIKQETLRWGKVVKESGAKAD
ncbi:Bug family tripartite tricarboxylate transporter substrate binding protein [Herbaspirillum sp. GCM10030257]|uniref:Bug family tripartite tricarboxylate transporter substrate binding protein n=1 Tax=Herbaspirillum sp. GCM10030257 TaxID=3273393 RepID=UPI0036095DA9